MPASLSHSPAIFPRRSDKIVHPHRIAAGGKQCPIGTSLVVMVGEPHPSDNFAVLYRALQLGGVPRDQPRDNRGLQARGTAAEPGRKTLSDRSSRTRNRCWVARKRQLAEPFCLRAH